MYKRISFIGGGRITQIFLKGLKCINKLPDTVTISDPDTETLKVLKNLNIPGLQVHEKNIGHEQAELVFIAVHPPLIKQVLPEIREQISAASVLISLAPVVNLSGLTQLLDGFDRIVRMIPNAASVIGNGYNPACFSSSITVNEKKDLLQLFNHWGETPEVEEDKLEAYAILTAMGPTYFWFQWQELFRLGRSFNLGEKEITNGLYHMITGASRLYFDSGFSGQEVIDMIPVRPLADNENDIKQILHTKLTGLYTKLTGRG